MGIRIDNGKKGATRDQLSWSPFREKEGKSHSNKGGITDPAAYYGPVDLLTWKCFVERKGEIGKGKETTTMASGQQAKTMAICATQTLAFLIPTLIISLHYFNTTPSFSESFFIGFTLLSLPHAPTVLNIK